MYEPGQFKQLKASQLSGPAWLQWPPLSSYHIWPADFFDRPVFLKKCQTRPIPLAEFPLIFSKIKSSRPGNYVPNYYITWNQSEAIDLGKPIVLVENEYLKFKFWTLSPWTDLAGLSQFWSLAKSQTWAASPMHRLDRHIKQDKNQCKVYLW